MFDFEELKRQQVLCHVRALNSETKESKEPNVELRETEERMELLRGTQGKLLIAKENRQHHQFYLERTVAILKVVISKMERRISISGPGKQAAGLKYDFEEALREWKTGDEIRLLLQEFDHEDADVRELEEDLRLLSEKTPLNCS